MARSTVADVAVQRGRLASVTGDPDGFGGLGGSGAEVRNVLAGVVR